MRSTGLFLIIILTVWSCENERSKRLRAESEFEKQVLLAIENGERVTEAFLTLEFGDTEPEVQRKLRALRSEGRIKVDDKSKYYYLLPVGIDNDRMAVAHFRTRYYDSKLYEVTLILTPGPDEMNKLLGVSEEELVILYYETQRLCMRKYGVARNESPGVIRKDLKSRIYRDLNKAIEVSFGFNDVRVRYSDLLIEAEIDSLETEELEAAKKQMFEDI